MFGAHRLVAPSQLFGCLPQAAGTGRSGGVGDELAQLRDGSSVHHCGGDLDLMHDSYHLIVCLRCGKRFEIGRSCFRGQIYCGPECSKAARRERVREAGRRYQAGEQGRAAHAERQRRYRDRKAQDVEADGENQPVKEPRVTHHSARQTSSTTAQESHGGAAARDTADAVQCVSCGGLALPFVFQKLSMRQRRWGRQERARQRAKPRQANSANIRGL